jgi:hypothetical protein
MLNRVRRKPFGQVKKGDTIYSLTYSKATVVIHKLKVLEVEKDSPESVTIRYSKPQYHFYAYSNVSRVTESWQFSKWVVTTTLEEAKEICREMTEDRIKECKEQIEILKNKIKKWEQYRTLLINDLYIIKQDGQ